MHTNPYQGLKHIKHGHPADVRVWSRYNAHESLSGIETTDTVILFGATFATMHTNPYQGLKQVSFQKKVIFVPLLQCTRIPIRD